MSGSGRLRAMLEAKRKEELRLENVRTQCNNLVNLLTKKLDQSKEDEKLWDIIGSMSNLMTNRITEVQIGIEGQPDQSLNSLISVSEEVNKFIAEVTAPQRNWMKEQEESYSKILNFIDEVDTINLTQKENKEQLDSHISKLNEFKKLSINKSNINSTISEVRQKVKEIVDLDQKEEERKEVVRQIIKSLKSIGFIVTKPTLEKEGVRLFGKLPTGRSVIFHVNEKSEINFDFDGYDGKSCRTELDGLLQKLESETGIKSSIDQFTWHNPDKIRKGAKEGPYSPVQQQAKGK